MNAETEPQPEPQELEDDIAELVCALAEDVVQNDVMCNGTGPTDALKQQLRNAMAKLIDDRIAAAMAARPGTQMLCAHEWREPKMWEQPCDGALPTLNRVCKKCGAME